MLHWGIIREGGSILGGGKVITRLFAIAALLRGYCSLAYSDLACFKMGMSGSASFQSVARGPRLRSFKVESVDFLGAGVAHEQGRAVGSEAAPRAEKCHDTTEVPQLSHPFLLAV